MDYAQSLPVEIIEKILSYLECLEDRKAAGLSCTRWYSAYLNPRLRRNDLVRFNNDKDFKQFQLQKDPTLRPFNFEFFQVDITRDSLQFWVEYGPFMKSLSLLKCYVGEKIFTEALSHCSALESLSVMDCKDLFMSGMFLETLKTHLRLRSSLRGLRHLNLSNNRYISDAIVHTILAMCPFLSSLSLSECPISFHHGMYRKFYPIDGLPPSETVLTFPNILHPLELRGRIFQNLDFSRTLLDNNALMNLALSDRLQLRVLDVGGCQQISDHGFVEMCATNNFSTLTHLDIGSCGNANSRVTDEALIAICSSMPQLTSLSMSMVGLITDAGIEHVSKLEKLQALNCAGLQLITGDGLVKGLAKRPFLKELALGQMGNLSEENFIKIVSNQPELTKLYANDSRAVTDASVQAIIKYNSKLRDLDISRCDAITDSGFTGKGLKGIAHKAIPNDKQQRIPLGSRHELDIRMDAEMKEQVKELCEQLEDDTAGEGESLAQLQRLQILTMWGCARVSDVSLEHAFFLKELRKLTLAMCQQISYAGLKHVAKNCRALEDVNLSSCHNVTDEAVQVLVEGLPRLKTLSLVGNESITGGIARIVEKSRLIRLSMIGCTKVRPEEVSHLKQRVKTLRELSYPEAPLRDEGPDVKPPKPPPFKMWKWCKR